MAYQLQPGIKLVTDNAVPTVCANEEVFVYPQPSIIKLRFIETKYYVIWYCAVYGG